jgi:hypothetical protein
MPIQKDLKKIVRARMEKTGEAYTAARVHVVNRKKEEPKQNYAPTAGMSDAAVKKATGRDWNEWVSTLDAIQAKDKTHRQIVDYVERVRGLRDMGQRRGGTYEANKSRTFAVPVETLFEAISNARTRKRWLDASMKVRTSNENKTIRASFDDGTLVQFYFTDKGNKSAVNVQHQKLADKEAATRMKEWWTEKLDALAKLLAD